jgi:hypothetical protein
MSARLEFGCDETRIYFVQEVEYNSYMIFVRGTRGGVAAAHVESMQLYDTRKEAEERLAAFASECHIPQWRGKQC